MRNPWQAEPPSPGRANAALTVAVAGLITVAVLVVTAGPAALIAGAGPAAQRSALAPAVEEDGPAPAATPAPGPAAEPASCAAPDESGAALSGCAAAEASADDHATPLPIPAWEEPATASEGQETAAGDANPAGGAGFLWPLTGAITSLFGAAHPLGIDIATVTGQGIAAIAAGHVAASGFDLGYGYYVVVHHAGGYTSLYAHLMAPAEVEAGEPIGQGQVIGYTGSTGRSTGPHLHLELYRAGAPVDPLGLLPAAPLTIDPIAFRAPAAEPVTCPNSAGEDGVPLQVPAGMESLCPTPAPTPTPTPTPTPEPSPAPEPAPTPTPAANEADATPSPLSTTPTLPSPTPTSTPGPSPSPSPAPAPRSTPTPLPTPSPVPTPLPTPTPSPTPSARPSPSPSAPPLDGYAGGSQSAAASAPASVAEPRGAPAPAEAGTSRESASGAPLPEPALPP